MPTTGERPVLTTSQWRGVRAELRSDRDGLPFTERATAVAKRAGVSRSMVYKWRRDPTYKQGVYWLWGCRIAEEMREQERPRRPEPLNKRQRAALIGAQLRREWPGSTVSHLDGKLYTTLEDYAEHVLASGAIFLADLPARR